MSTWSVVFERTPTGWSAYVPVLPGLAVTAASREEAVRLIARGFPSTSKGSPKKACPFPIRTASRSKPSPCEAPGRLSAIVGGLPGLVEWYRLDHALQRLDQFSPLSQLRRQGRKEKASTLNQIDTFTALLAPRTGGPVAGGD